jgi:hypothetical protein
MPAMGAHTHQPDTGVTTMTQPHIPGLITATGGVTPPAAPAQPAQITQPGTPAVQPAPAAQAAPVPVTQAVQAAPPQDPAAAAVAVQLPTTLSTGVTTTTLPGLTVTVPGLNPPAVAVPGQPTVQQPANPPQDPATGTDADRGYPQGTPLEQMNAEQREAYWKYHARQWETRAKERNDYDAVKAKAGQYDQLVASQATDQEKAITAARAEGERSATARAAVVLVDAHVRAGLQQRLQPHQVEALASNLNHQHFLGADGLTVDAAKVLAFVDTVAPQAAATAVTVPAVPATPGALPVGVPYSAQPPQPATGLPRQLPDLGQGAQTSAPLDKLEAGRQQARAFLANGGNR